MINGEENGVGLRRPHIRGASSINCRDFDSKKDDFGRWIQKFEKAVKLATNARDGDDQLHFLYKEWLSLKLDDDATSHLDTLDTERLDWDQIKDQLAELLIDPQEELLWRSREVTVVWDGQESVHLLANRIKRGVDKHYKAYPQAVRELEYYNRFRVAFEWPIKRVIDVATPKGHQTLANATNAVSCYLLSSQSEKAAKGGAQTKAGDPYKAVQFAGPQLNSGQLHPDRATSLETSMASLATSMENMSLSMRAMEQRSTAMEQRFEDRFRALEDAQRHDSHRQGGPPSGGYDYRSSGGTQQQQRGYSPGRNNYNGSQQQQRGFSPGRNNYNGSQQQQRGYSPGRNNYNGSQQQQRGFSPGRNNYGGPQQQRGFSPGRKGFGGQDGQSGQSGGQGQSRGNFRGNSSPGNNGFGRNDQGSGSYSGPRPTPGQGNRQNADSFRAIDTEDEGSYDEAEHRRGERENPERYAAAYNDNGACHSGRGDHGEN